MTPDELKKIALDVTKKEYENILEEMKKTAESGSYSCEFSNITDGAITQLKSAGFDVKHQYRMTEYMTDEPYFIVRFAN